MHLVSILLLLASCLLSVSPARAAVGSCPNATLSFGAGTYNAGDRITLNGSDSEGDWALCIYDPSGSRVAVTAVGKIGSVSATASANGTYHGVIRIGAQCSMNYSTAGDCQAATAVGSASAGTGTGTGTGSGTGTGASIEIQNPIGTDDFTALVQNVLRWLLSVAGGIALFMLIYGGTMYIASTGDQQKAEQGKRIVTWTILGLVLILLSYSIVLVIDGIFAN